MTNTCYKRYTHKSTLKGINHDSDTPMDIAEDLVDRGGLFEVCSDRNHEELEQSLFEAQCADPSTLYGISSTSDECMDITQDSTEIDALMESENFELVANPVPCHPLRHRVYENRANFSGEPTILKVSNNCLICGQIKKGGVKQLSLLSDC